MATRALPLLLRRIPSADERGASAAEYGLLIAGVAAVIAAAILLFGGSVLDLFTHTCNTVANTNGQGTC